MHGRRQRAGGGTLLAGLHDARKPEARWLEGRGALLPKPWLLTANILKISVSGTHQP